MRNKSSIKWLAPLNKLRASVCAPNPTAMPTANAFCE
jgi:hypothetical protein